MRKLTDLHPVLKGYTRPNSGEQLEFDCPVCPPSKRHRLTAVLAKPIDGRPPWPHHQHLWHHGGEIGPIGERGFSLMPSIHYPDHWHGFVKMGWVFNLDECVPTGRHNERGQPIVGPPPVTADGTPLRLVRCSTCPALMFTDGLVSQCEMCKPRV